MNVFRNIAKKTLSNRFEEVKSSTISRAEEKRYREDDLLALGFDKDGYRQTHELRGLFHTLEYGSVWASSNWKGSDKEVDTGFFFAKYLDKLMVCKTPKENFTIEKKAIFKKPETVYNWRYFRKIANRVKDMNSSDLRQYKEAQMTVVSLNYLLNVDSAPEFDEDFYKLTKQCGFFEVLDKKFKMESYLGFMEIEKLLENADPKDSFYKDLKVNYKKLKDSYCKAAVEYLDELSRFQSEFRQHQHLKVLSVVGENFETVND